MNATTEMIYGQPSPNGWMTYEAIGIGLHRVIFTCKTCKHIWAHDYRRGYTSMGGHTSGRFARYDQPRYDLIRVDAAGEQQRYDFDAQCPSCQRKIGIRSNVVRGSYSDAKKCDSRCRNAKGSDCECQCAGANHGAGHLM